MTGRTAGPFDRSLADRVRFARRVAGMSQHDLAAAIGSRVSQVRRYETGMASISAATLLRIAVALDAPLGWLYGVEDADHWPDTLLASLLHDEDMPALVNAFAGIADSEARQMVLSMARGLNAAGTAAAAPPDLSPPARPVCRPMPAGPGRRALLVDDAPDVLVVVGAFLRSGGFEVVHAGGAEAALETIRRDAPLDVLVTDYAMPDISGLELVRLAKELRPGLAAVVITAFAADLALDARRLPGVMVLAKPFARTDLLNAVHIVCGSVEAGVRHA